MAFGVVVGVTSGAPIRMASGAAVGLTGGIAISLITGIVNLAGVAGGVAGGIAGSVAVNRLPLWPAEAFLTQLLAWQMRRRPDAVRRLSSWLPFLYHDLIYLPLPGLRTCLIQIAEADPTLGKDLIAQATASTGQSSVARRALIEIQARALERAARDRLFSSVAELDLPFLPGEADLASQPTNAPFLSLQTAARDLVAGSANQRQRRLALERARKSVESFRIAIAGTSRRSPLARRLLLTAALWLDVSATKRPN